jgi:hypothetical protein
MPSKRVVIDVVWDRTAFVTQFIDSNQYVVYHG